MEPRTNAKLISSFLLLLSTVALYAQGPKKGNGLKHLAIVAAPKPILNAINKEFPGSTGYDFISLPVKYIKQNWAVAFEERYEPHHEYFQVELNQNHEQIEALYEDNGKLISTKTREHYIDSPKEIKNSVNTLFSGWSANPIVEKLDFPSANHKLIYYVEVDKKHHAKKIAFDSEGHVLSEIKMM